ncbi:MAG: PD40 domain-containing protein [Deinococcus sp.]|nr:PD40 domain-containing protein [Deinococcus sp.]
MTPFERAVAAILLALALLSAAVLALGDRTRPRLVAYGPRGELSAYAQAWLRFSRAMDHSSVEEALRIDSPTPWKKRWEGERLVLEPLAPLPYGTVVRFQLAALASDAHGQAMGRALSWTAQVHQPRLVYLDDLPQGQAFMTALAGPARRLGIMASDLAPDRSGTQLAVEVWTPDPQVMVLNLLSGSQQTIPVENNTSISAPGWAPDGRLFFDLRELLALPDGTILTLPRPVYRTLEPVVPRRAADFGYAPRWSPDSSRLAFLLPDQGAGVWDSSSTVRLNGPSSEPGSWAPDSRRLAIVTPVPEQFRAALAVWEVLSNQVTTVAGGERNYREPRWHPVAERVAYIAVSGNQEQVEILNLVDASTTGLYGTDQFISDLAWSPAGEYLAFKVERTIMVWDGNQITSVAQGDLPKWVP